ncbi:MAG: hypothetical protein QMD99_20875 [Rhizobiaceae bacterium]|nr:hypothetical protein [Rhizobiaceae bacterium]
MGAKFLVSACLAVVATALSVTDSQAGTPRCDDAAVVGSVESRFTRNNRQFLKVDLSIADIGIIRETGFRPTDETHRVERRFCHATVTTSDGLGRNLWYLIESTWGFAGLGSSVEFCADGLDPWHVYGARCASLR